MVNDKRLWFSFLCADCQGPEVISLMMDVYGLAMKVCDFKLHVHIYNNY